MQPEEIENLNATSNKLSGNCPGVYFLFDGKELVYIGKGWNCLLRVAEHTRKESDKIFTSWNFIHIENDEERDELERKLVRNYKPKFNMALR